MKSRQNFSRMILSLPSPQRPIWKSWEKLFIWVWHQKRHFRMKFHSTWVLAQVILIKKADDYYYLWFSSVSDHSSKNVTIIEDSCPIDMGLDTTISTFLADDTIGISYKAFDFGATVRNKVFNFQFIKISGCGGWDRVGCWLHRHDLS